MNSLLPALALAGMLIAGGAAVSFVPQLIETQGDGEDAAAHDDVDAAKATMRSGGGHMGAYAWSGGTGKIPELPGSLPELQRHGNIVIRNDRDFTPAAGVRSGTGTFEDPFVISGWFVESVIISDTTKAFVFTGNYVNNILILDWTGQGGYVHHNNLNDFRTNRNVARTGDPSASVIENNLILRVEELRHFDGEVRNNTIGRAGLDLPTDEPVVFNIAGLNGAGIHDNTIYGGVDMKIHGHHHSSQPGVQSHNHGTADELQAESDLEDHQVRYVDFLFYGNRIVDTGFGLRYNDLNHAGDDRRAASEQEPALEKPHVHHTTVRILDNVIDGSTLRIVVLNSVDERHLDGESAFLEIAGNRILKPSAGDGLVLQNVRNARVEIRDNVVEKGQLQLSGKSAILLRDFSNTSVVIGGNSFGAWTYGVRASVFDEATRWTVLPNSGTAKTPIFYDSSVVNAPENGEEGDGRDDTHA